MKLIFISPFPPLRGGISKETETIYNFFKKNHQVNVISYKKLYPKLFFPGKTQYLNENKYKDNKDIVSLLNPVNPFTWIKASNYIIRSNCEQVIIRYWHPFFIPMYLFIINRIKRKRPNVKINYICDNIFSHNKFPLNTLLIKKFLNKVDKCFLMSDNTLNQVKDYVSLNKTKKVFLPIKSDFGPLLNKKESQDILNIKSDFVILFFGLIREYKGLDILLKSLGSANTLNKNVKLLIVGESYENKNKYLKLIKDFKLEDSVTWINEYVPDEKVNLYFSACDLVILPYKKASQSGILPIAYNYNKIVLASDINGLNEFIHEGKNGYLFDNLNHTSLLNKLNFIISSHDFLESDAYINEYKKHFSIEQLEKDIVSTLE